MTDIEDVPEEQRAADQDSAVEAAFAAGTLPEEDRRAEAVAELPVEEVIAPPTAEEVCATLDAAGIGTRLEKQSHGWKLQLVDGGTVVLSEGATLSLALHRG